MFDFICSFFWFDRSVFHFQSKTHLFADVFDLQTSMWLFVNGAVVNHVEFVC